MAKGDVVSDLQDIAASGNLDYQPAAGVETMITEVFFEGASGNVRLYDGTLTASRILSSLNDRANVGPSKVIVTNSIYLRMNNGSTANNELGFCGIQTNE